MPSRHPYLLLHFVVLIWGLTSVLGKAIELPTLVLVAWRTGLAAVGMFIWMNFKGKSLWPGWKVATQMGLVGALIGFHWFLFFLPGKLGSISIGLIGLATCSLWCALLEPLFIRGKRLHAAAIWISLCALGGAVIIGMGNPVSWPSLFIGIGSAVAAAIFSYLNNSLAQRHDKLQITLFEMAGACVFMCAVSTTQGPQRILPQGIEWMWLGVLSLLCTVWAFTVYISLLKQLSVFTISLVSNLEPVWGVLMAGLVYGEFAELNLAFWIGGFIVLAASAGYPLLERRNSCPEPILP